MTKLFNYGEVSLINFMGGDLAVVAAARVSNGISYEEASKGEEKDAKLISYLVKHRHGSPFEHSTFQFYIKAPLFVVREWQRHRIASYNEVSGRYVEFKPEFYIPERARVPGSSTKQGSVFPEGLTSEEEEKFNDSVIREIYEASFKAFSTYDTLINYKGVANELARIVLPLNTYSEFYFTINARSLMNFLSLRAAEDAQYEIRQYAYILEGIFKESMPQTWAAWNNNGRISP